MIIAIRTDQPQAEVGVHTSDGTRLSYHTWLAHRQLSATLLGVIRDELSKQAKSFEDVTGIIVFKGPGSFTGLRIGITVANSLAYGLGIPIAGAESDQWIANGLQELQANHDDKLVMPTYGAEANITVVKK
jgi:tRNA threonylcarbamoyladenosine biosynthesis protein TsaB